MGKSVFDYNDGDFIFSTSSLGFDSDGNMLMHLGDNMALEVEKILSQYDFDPALIEIEITETSTGFYNERQKVMVTLDKVLEQALLYMEWEAKIEVAIKKGLNAQEMKKVYQEIRFIDEN